MEENQLLSVEETASLLHVTEVHLRKLLEEGTIPYVNVASANKSRKSIRIEQRAIDKYIKRGGIK